MAVHSQLQSCRRRKTGKNADSEVATPKLPDDQVDPEKPPDNIFTTTMRTPLIKIEAAMVAYGILLVCVFVSMLVLYLLIPSCASVPECSQRARQEYEGMQGRSMIFGAGLSLWAKETKNLMEVWSVERHAPLTNFGMPGSLGVRFSLFLVLSVLVTCDGLQAFGFAMAWSLTGPASPGAGWMPIDIVRYTEWMINVPVIHVILFTFLLDIPFEETHLSNITSNLYIFLALLALTTPSVIIRWSLVTLSFALFGYTTMLQLQMVEKFRARSPPSRPGYKSRIGLTIFILVFYLIYGCIYLARLFLDRYDGNTYMMFDVIAKFAISICLADVWNLEQKNATVALVVSHARWSMSYLSVLRSSYDYVLPCEAGSPEETRIMPSPDATALGQVMSRDVEGELFHNLMYDSKEATRFREYVRQVLSTKASRLSFQPAIAQALHVDLKGGTEGKKLPAVLFLSAPVSAGRVMAVRTTDCEAPNSEQPGISAADNDFWSRVSNNEELACLQALESDADSTDMPLTGQYYSSSGGRAENPLSALDTWTEHQAAWIGHEILNMCGPSAQASFGADRSRRREPSQKPQEFRPDTGSTPDMFLPNTGALEGDSGSEISASTLGTRRRMPEQNPPDAALMEQWQKWKSDAMSELPSLHGSVLDGDSASEASVSTIRSALTKKHLNADAMSEASGRSVSTLRSALIKNKLTENALKEEWLKWKSDAISDLPSLHGSALDGDSASEASASTMRSVLFKRQTSVGAASEASAASAVSLRSALLKHQLSESALKEEWMKWKTDAMSDLPSLHGSALDCDSASEASVSTIRSALMKNQMNADAMSEASVSSLRSALLKNQISESALNAEWRKWKSDAISDLPSLHGSMLDGDTASERSVSTLRSASTFRSKRF